MITHKTFEDYCAQRWELSRKRAYDQVAAAAVVSQICDKNMPPPAIESHAAALAAAPEHLRGLVWAKVREATGGRPTARAVAEAVVSVTAAWDAAQPVTPEEKAAYREAYEAARPAGGGQPAYDAAGREAVLAYRREHGDPVPPGRENDDAGHTEPETATETAETKTEPDPEPGTAAAENIADETAETKTEPDPEPEHVHVYEMTCSCGAIVPEHHVLAVVGQREAELVHLREYAAELEKAKDARIAELEAEVRELEARLSEPAIAAEQPDPGTGPPTETEAADLAHGNGQAAPGAGPCVKCGQPGTPFLYDGEETGKFACGSCFANAEARDEPVSRPWDSLV
jgi:hypothetical protein